MTFPLALLLFTIVVMVLWLIVYATRKPVILFIARRILRRGGEPHHVNDFLNEMRDQAYLTPLDMFQLRQKLDLAKGLQQPARSHANYLTAAFRRTFLFWRNKHDANQKNISTTGNRNRPI